MSPLADHLEFEPLNRLRPDPASPRLPPKLRNADDLDLFVFLERNYNAVSLGGR